MSRSGIATYAGLSHFQTDWGRLSSEEFRKKIDCDCVLQGSEIYSSGSCPEVATNAQMATKEMKWKCGRRLEFSSAKEKNNVAQAT